MTSVSDPRSAYPPPRPSPARGEGVDCGRGTTSTNSLHLPPPLRGRVGVGGTRPRERGFTLIELLVVLAILSLLVAVVGPRVVDYFSRSKVDIARLQIDQLGSSLDLFRLDVG